MEADWGGRHVRAWVPTPLDERDLTLSTAVARVAERAAAALQLADARLPSEWEPLARLLLRHEGVASSGIEGLRESIGSVLVAERTGSGGTAGWVADNLAVLDSALDTADEPLSAEMLHQWHQRLMRHGRLPAPMVGRFRPALGWIGGTSPIDAAYVPPPPAEIPRLIDDLISFADDDRSDLDAVSRAALAHAQFEAIHPYGDGNGRLGRVLVSRGTAPQRRHSPLDRAHQRGHRPGSRRLSLRTASLRARRPRPVGSGGSPKRRLGPRPPPNTS